MAEVFSSDMACVDAIRFKTHENRFGIILFPFFPSLLSPLPVRISFIVIVLFMQFMQFDKTGQGRHKAACTVVLKTQKKVLCVN